MPGLSFPMARYIHTSQLLCAIYSTEALKSILRGVTCSCMSEYVGLLVKKAHLVIFQHFGNLLDDSLLDGTELPVVYL